MELFRYPALLAWLTAAFAALVFFRSRAEEKRRALARLVLGPAAERLDSAPGAGRRGLRDFFFLAALGLAVAAAAGPQWGVELSPVTDLKGNIVIAVDTSLSMAARDLKPSRLENARLLLGAIAEQFADYRIGVAAFAGQAYIQCPLTTDQEAITYFATALKPGMLPVQGTDFPAAIRTALGMLARYSGQKVMVLITDGESHSKELDAALASAAEQNLKIFTIGIGTPDGELVPMTDSYGNTMEYKKDSNGKTVVSRLDENTLMKIARQTGAAYLRYTGPDEAAQEIRKAIDSLDLEKARGRGRANFKNRYQWPLALALTLLLLELTLMEKGWRFSLKLPGFLRRKFFPGAALLLFACLGRLSAAQPDALARKGNSAYAKEDWAAASEYYSKAAQTAPEDKRFNFNLGAAYYRLEDYPKAAEAFEAGAAGPKLAARAGFNRANALLKSNDLPGAISGYRGVLKLDPSDENAKFNLQKALEMKKESKNNCKDPKEDKKDKDQKKKEGDDKKDKKGGGGGDQDKQKQDAQKEQERRKAEAKEKSRQILEMMKEKEKEAARGNKSALQTLQKGKPPPQPKAEDW
ncbi:MAG TPA: VWA domain-containing protein [Elusimicrobiales bacterium]|nr:VWA domain-containing protein [Elusimicrobiales bacterium]